MHPLIIIALSLSWGASNRGRGWGPMPGAPAWQVKLSGLLSRDTMALWHALTAGWAAWHLGLPLWWQAAVFGAATGALWRFAVSPGWGSYQDGWRILYDEIGWIDWLLKKLAKVLPARIATDPKWMDGIGMGLRGVYYLPIYGVAGYLTQSWWFLLPAAFFWQAGVIYAVLWKRIPEDQRIAKVVFYAEWVDDTVRGLLFFTATALALAA